MRRRSPVSMRPPEPDHNWGRDPVGLSSLAKEVLTEHGRIDREQLVRYLSFKGVTTDAWAHPALTAEVTLAKADGSLWQPTYQGIAGSTDPEHRTAVLWQLVVDHPNATAIEIVRLAFHAGLGGRLGLVTEAKRVIAAAERHGRRHPILNIADRMKDSSVHELIDAVLIAETRLDPGAVVLRLYDLNLRGTRNFFRVAVADRQRALANVPPEEGDIAAARKRLTLTPDPTFMDEKLDAGDPTDRVMIEKLAYAAAWAHKTESADKILVRLAANGVTGSHDVLAGLVARVIESADRHGDRLVPLTAALSTHHHAIRERTADILAKFPQLRHSATPYPVNKLAAQMRRHHITGPQTTLRGIAEAALDTDPASLSRPLVLRSGSPGSLPAALDATAEADLEAIYRRTSDLVLQLTRTLATSGKLYEDSRSLHNPDNPHRFFALMRHMTENGIFGPEEALLKHAETVLQVRTDRPVPGKYSIPFPVAA